MKHKIKASILILVCLLIVTGTGVYLGRNIILQKIARNRITQIEDTYNLKILYGSLRMPELNRIELTDLSIIPNGSDTLLALHSLQLELDFNEMLRMNLILRQVTTDGIHVNFIKKGASANYAFLFQKESGYSVNTRKASPGFSDRASESLDLLFHFLPENGEIRNFIIKLERDSVSTEITIPDLSIKDDYFETSIIVKENGMEQHWLTEGQLHSDEKALEAKIYAKEDKKVCIPYIEKNYNMQVTFDTISYSLFKGNIGRKEISLSGKAEIDGLSIFHEALSPETINLERGLFNYRINMGEKYIELDSATVIQFNKLQFNPYIRATKEKEWRVITAINKPFFPAEDLFSSLPKGLFSNLEGLKTEGELAYHFLLSVDFSEPDSLVLESELKEKDFNIVSFGKTKLTKMNKEFTYTAYEEGEPARSFAVGPSNPYFRPLDSISPLLQMAVLQSEDGAFFRHKGFLIKAMREALIHDLKVQRFARGGSTITMQLVKNVFLNRNKNIARKLEEALIVWLIETEELTTKERMYEVYLNVIEWGPIIYGACEASEYYFKKEPSQLTTNEAIFLASIVPKPKQFRQSFDKDLQLRKHLAGYYRIIAKRLNVKGLITETEADSIRPEIKVTGEAKREFALSKDSMKYVLEKRMDKK